MRTQKGRRVFGSVGWQRGGIMLHLPATRSGRAHPASVSCVRRWCAPFLLLRLEVWMPPAACRCAHDSKKFKLHRKSIADVNAKSILHTFRVSDRDSAAARCVAVDSPPGPNKRLSVSIKATTVCVCVCARVRAYAKKLPGKMIKLWHKSIHGRALIGRARWGMRKMFEPKTSQSTKTQRTAYN